MTRLLRRLAAALAFAGLCACTFPSVDYAGGAGDGGPSDGDGGTDAPACMASGSCASTAVSCGKPARNEWKGCTNHCHGDAACEATCEATLRDGAGACITACEGCAGCTDATESCTQLATGLPG